MAEQSQEKLFDPNTAERGRQRKRASYVTMLGKTIRRLSTVLELDEEEIDVEEEEGEEVEEIKQKLAAHENRVKQLLANESTELKLSDRKIVLG